MVGVDGDDVVMGLKDGFIFKQHFTMIKIISIISININFTQYSTTNPQKIL